MANLAAVTRSELVGIMKVLFSSESLNTLCLYLLDDSPRFNIVCVVALGN